MGVLSVKQVLYPLSGVVLALLVIEVLLQAAAFVSPPLALLLSPGIPRSLPDDRIGHRPNPALPGHDADGWRNPEVLSRADIVALGDSQTYGDEVARENAWPLVLGRLLRVDAYNMGLSGFGPVTHYLLAPEAIARQPGFIVVGIYSGNDFVDAYGHSGRAPELLVGAPFTPEELAQVEASREPLNAPWARARAARRGAWKTLRDQYLGPLESHSKLWGLVRGIEVILKDRQAGPRGDSVRTDFDKYASKIGDLPVEDYFAVRGPASASVLTPSGRAAAVNIEDPRIQQGVFITLQAVAGIRDRCGDSCGVLTVLIPTKELVFESQVKASGVTPPAPYRELLAHEKELWTQMHEGLEERGIAYIDLREVLAASANAGRNPYLSDWDGHPNVVGNEVIARSVAQHPKIRGLARP